MVTLAEIRAQHPEYRDLSDQQLAQGLHGRFYSDMSFDEFSRRVGLTSTPGYQTALRREGEREAFMRQNDPLSGVNQWGSQIVRNLGVGDELAGAGAYVAQGGINLARRATGQPIEVRAGEAGQAAMDFERGLGRDYARQRPLANAGAVAAGIAAGGAPAAGPVAPMSALRAGTTFAGINLPFAFGRQEGTLQERLPGAVRETATVGLFGAALQGGANALGRVTAPSRRAGEFERAGVSPILAATHGSTGAPMTMAIAENPVGGNVRANLQRSVEDVRDASQRIAERYGTRGQPEQVGEAVQQGIQRFARSRNEPLPPGATPQTASTRDWSFAARSGAVYDEAFRPILADERAIVQDMGRSPVTTQATRNVLAAIQGRARGPNVSELVSDPIVGRIANAIEGDEAPGLLRFNDLRELRTFVRQAQRTPQLRQSIDDASLQRIEAALTQDIAESARAIGGSVAADRLRRADQFYRAGQERITRALQPFAGLNPRQAYDRILNLAREGGRQNSQALRSLRQSLRPDEWRQVTATIIDDMGRPLPGNAQALEEGAFSLENFVTNYAKLSEEGRRALFGGNATDELARELDNLARVAGYLKQVRGFSNYSRSGSSLQNVGTIGAAASAATLAATGNPGPLAALLGAAAGLRITGEVLTNPAFVRWLASAQTAAGAAGGMRQHMARLAQIAARDPALAPVYTELSRLLPASAGGPANTPPQMQRATP